MTRRRRRPPQGMLTRPREDRGLLMRDLMDLQLETADEADIGRVDDVEGVIGEDGSLVITAIRTGPEALAGRVSSRLRPLAERLLGGRLDGRIAIEEIEDLGLTIRLRGSAADYPTGRSERWLAEHVVRHVPGSRR